eukprot:g12880.t1
MAACDFRVMLAIDPKNDSSLMATCLSRLWCLYELAICNEPNCQLDLIQTKLDVRAPLKKASMVSHFLTKEEQEAELRAPTSGYKAQSDREKSFSLTTMDLALHVSIAKARITNETERRQILKLGSNRIEDQKILESQNKALLKRNSLARREPTEEVVEEPGVSELRELGVPNQLRPSILPPDGFHWIAASPSMFRDPTEVLQNPN